MQKRPRAHRCGKCDMCFVFMDYKFCYIKISIPSLENACQENGLLFRCDVSRNEHMAMLL